MYEKIDVDKTIAEIEKGMVKYRYDMNAEQERGDTTKKRKSTKENRVYDPDKKSFDFRNMKATDMPNNKKVGIPPVTQTTEELRIRVLKSELIKVTEAYSKEEKGMWSNVTAEEKRGLKSLLKKKKNKEIVTNVTDKSGRFSVDTVENYINLSETHVGKDRVIDEEQYQQLTKEMNGHAICWCKMTNAGKETGQETKIKNNFCTEKPPLSGHRTLRKDHKTGFDPVIGPPGRPLCSADSSYNYSMSHLISSILREMIDEEPTQCENTEDMLAAFQELNESGNIDDDTVILSADVVALYPSLNIDFTTDKVCEMFYESNIDIKGVDYEEVGLYLSLTRTTEDIEQLGLQDYCPTRKHKKGSKPTITSCGSKMKKDERYESWNLPKKKTTEEDTGIRRKMFTEALRTAILFIMKNHVYEFDNKIHKQEEGGAIGVELTGDLAKVFMVWWTKQFLQKARQGGEEIKLYKTYVDDINIAMTIPANIRSREITADEKEKETANRVKELGDSIDESIVVETDCPSNHADNKLPILDLKVWLEKIDGKRIVVHEFYQKEVSSKATIHARSTLPWKTKHTILVQQSVRILRNCSKNLPWTEVTAHLTNMSMRMQYSGYDKKFRHDVITTALETYRKMRENDEKGETPLYRSKMWKRKERREAKRKRKRNWHKTGGYKSVIFVPSTPDSTLLKRYRQKVEESGIPIKLIEKSGQTLDNILRTSDPRKESRCNREDCPVCTTGGKGNCKQLNVNYRMTCECDDEYTGTTTRSAYVRGSEQNDNLQKESDKSDLWDHCRKKHAGEKKSFRMDVIDSFRRDPLLRQVTEATRICRADKERSINKKEEIANTGTR